MKCLNTLQVDNSECLEPCTGLIVTSFSKSRSSYESMEDPLTSLKEDYEKYKYVTQIPTGKPGLFHYLTIVVLIN